MTDCPVFPPEIFGEIIDTLAIQTPGMALTDNQIATLQVCVLVCKLFQTLSEPHLHRYVSFGLQESRREQLNRLVNLLETRPAVMEYIRHVNIDLRRFRPTLDNETTADFENIDLIVSLPNVESININYSRVSYRQPETLNSQNLVGSLCYRIIEGHVLHGTLHSLIAKKLGDLPFTLMATRPMLHTLSLDRCNLASLSQAIPSVKHLTLRKMNLSISTLSLFPNVEELHVIRLDIEECVDTSRFPAPSFKIKTLVLERCSRRGGIEAVNHSISSLWTYFQSKAHEKGVLPFEHLQTLGMSFYDDPAYPITRQLLKEAPSLQNMFLAFPSYRLDIRDLVCKSIYRVESLQYTYLSTDDGHISDVGFMSQAAFMRHYMSYHPSFSANSELVTHPAFAAPLIHAETRRSGVHNLAHTTLKAWTEWVTLLKDVYPNATGLEATHVLMIDQRPIVDEGEGFDEVAEKIAKKAGRLWGVHFSGFNDHHAVHPMKLVFFAS